MSVAKWLKTRLRETKRQNEANKYMQSLPVNYAADDIYLVSYPKSGNTWLRFLLSNAIKLHYQIDREVNFFTIQEIIPGAEASRNIKEYGPFGKYDFPRILKSHNSYNPYFLRVVLLVRDPRDVIVSHYHYAISRKSISNDWDLSRFVRDKKYGPEAWLKHTKSWYSPQTIKPAQRIVLFRYEDFLQNTIGELKRITELLGISVSQENLRKAVELSSKETMRASEKKHMSTARIANQKSSFVRKGEATQGAELSNSDRQYIEDVTRETARLVGYDF